MKLDIDNNEALVILKALEDSHETFLIKRIKLAVRLDAGSRKRVPSSDRRESTMEYRKTNYNYSTDKVY